MPTIGTGRFFPVGVACLAVLAGAVAPASAQEDEEKPVVPRDRASHALAGERVDFFEEPAVDGAQPGACSPREPVCVAVAAGSVVPEARRLQALVAAEEAYGTLVHTLGLPPPLAPLGGASMRRFTVLLKNEETASALPIARDATSRFDRVSSVGLADASVGGCVLAANVTAAVAGGISWRVAPAQDAGSRDGLLTSLVSLTVPCAAPLAAAAIARAQSHPNDAVIAADRSEFAAPLPPAQDGVGTGSTLFFDWLDGTLAARPGGALVGVWAAAATRTPIDARRWVNEPDTFDVLATSAKGAFGTNSDLGDLFLHFGTDRLFFATAPKRFPWAGGYRAATPLAADRRIPWPDAPRRFLHPRPVAHSGMTAVAIDLAGRPAGKRLRAEITWEDFAHFRFQWVTVGADGLPLAAYPIAGEARGTAANGTLVNLDGATQALLIGTSDGDPRYPFDPDDEVWEAHGYDLVIAGVD
jgi:hypothetical protein